MAADEKWYFTKEQLQNTPSRRCGIDADKELSYRQQAANFIQDMGQRLSVSQLCINTAIVYMHRFYVFHSLSHFHRNAIAAAALFLAAKVEEQPRKLEHVIKVAHMCLHREQSPPDIRSEQYLEQAQDLVFNEDVLLQTLGFDVAIDHPHTHVVKCCQLVKASKDLAQTSYFMASNSLHLTTMCLQYKPTVVACFCIHLACKWSNWEIPQSNEGKYWFWYVDKSVTIELLQQLTAEFLHIFDKCPSRLKRKIMSASANQSPSMNHSSLTISPFDVEPRRIQSPANAIDGGPVFHSNRLHYNEKQQDEKKTTSSMSTRPPADYREYREKKERERLEREKASVTITTSINSTTATANAASTTTATTTITTTTSSTTSSTAQNHSTDTVKHHSHHHKTLSSGNPNNKHLLQSGQKGLHPNHHHRSEIKANQSMQQQRHSTSNLNQPRDSTRQRSSRDYNSTTTHSSHGHQAGHQQTEISQPDALHRTESSSSSSQESQEKPLGNHRYPNVDNKLISSSHDKQQRGYDPRSKPVEHRKETDQKSYSKYSELTRVDRQRKPTTDILEQRCEEVRKLIEKPLPPPKPTLEISQYMANTQKQPSHHNKYPQSEKHSNVSMTDQKGNVLVSDKSPSTFQKQPQPSNSSKYMSSASLAHGGAAQIMKDSMKNGNPQMSTSSLNNIDDPKAEKRPRHEDAFEASQNFSHTIVPSRHKSLFSPEKTVSHSQRSKSKQKTPPSALKPPKIERIPTDPGLSSSFSSPVPPSANHEIKRANEVQSSHKKHKALHANELPEVKVKVEDIALAGSLDAMKMLGRIPELIQPIKDNPLSNSSRANTCGVGEVKFSESLKTFQHDGAIAFLHQQGQVLTNGLNMKTDPEVSMYPDDRMIKKETNEPVQRPETPMRMDHPPLKVEYLSPAKSVESISALLHEPLTPLPSLLQHSTPVTSQNQFLDQSMIPQQLLLPDYSSQSEVCNEQVPVLSTVDMSALSVPISTDSLNLVPVSSTAIVPPIIVTPCVEEKRNEHHHKSEKKKKKEKHKHKDKDKSKEKHKHKHKDKDKEKHHRDKDKDNKTPDEPVPTIPIKITIPKDKLNLSTDSATAALRCKIKLTKERHKGASEQNVSLSSVPLSAIVTTGNAIATCATITTTSSVPSATVVQAPLKIKIRTDSISRGGLLPMMNSEHQTTAESRKRAISNEAHGHSSPVKKQAIQQAQQHRSGERQNGRHYSGTNNKVRGAGRGGGRYFSTNRVPPPPSGTTYATSHQQQQQLQRDGYNYRQDYSGNSLRSCSSHPLPPRLSHPPDGGGISFGTDGGPNPCLQSDSFYFTNFPPPNLYPTGYMYDPAAYYQQYPHQYGAYPTGTNLIVTPDGTIDTSVPPPTLRQSTIIQKPNSPPPLPSGPPPGSSPPPPPPPPE